MERSCLKSLVEVEGRDLGPSETQQCPRTGNMKSALRQALMVGLLRETSSHPSSRLEL